MQEQRKKGKNIFSIVVAAVVIVGLVIGVIAWQNWEKKHKKELRSFVTTAEQIAGYEEPPEESEPAKPKPKLPEDPNELLAMAGEALKDEGYFESGTKNKGFKVYLLLKKTLECDGDVEKVESLCKSLKDRSAKSDYGEWYVGSDLFEELDQKIDTAKQL
jgi:hypothetical protein